MFSNIFSMVAGVFGSVVSFFGQLLSGLPGAAAFIIAAFFITVVVQLILVPIRGGRSFGSGSDKAGKKSKKTEDA